MLARGRNQHGTSTGPAQDRHGTGDSVPRLLTGSNALTAGLDLGASKVEGI